MDATLFEHLPPTEQQKIYVQEVQEAFKVLAGTLERLVPDGSDRIYAMRRLREVAMWVNIAITRNPNGSPRVDTAPPSPVLENAAVSSPESELKQPQN